ncbi:hypothetical protein QTP88_022298 [Uroleucon formosanum]
MIFFPRLFKVKLCQKNITKLIEIVLRKCARHPVFDQTNDSVSHLFRLNSINLNTFKRPSCIRKLTSNFGFENRGTTLYGCDKMYLYQECDYCP